MKTRQKTAIMLCTAIGMASLLSACGDKQPTETNVATNSSTATVAPSDNAAPSLEPYTVTLYYPGSPQQDEQLVEAKINEYLKEKINASLDLKPIDWGAWSDKTNLMFASSEPADLIFTASWNGHYTNVKKGAYLELSELIDKHGKGIIDNINPAFLEGAKIGGKLYSIPTNKEIAASKGVVYRKDIADKLGLDMSTVKSMSDLEPIFKVVKEKEPDITPFYSSKVSNYSSIINNYDSLGDGIVPGIIYKDKQDTTVFNENEKPETLEVYKTLHDWFKKGYINSDAVTNQVSQTDAAKAGNIFMWAESLKPGKDKELEASVGKPLAQIEFIAPYITTSDTTNSMIAISKTSKNPERAMMVLNMLHSDATLINLLDFGVEGTHYVKVSDNIIKFPDHVDPKNHPYNHGSAWMFGNQFITYIWENEDPAKWDKFREFNATAKPSVGLGFVFDPEPIKTELAALTNAGKEFGDGLATGSIDPVDILPKYVAKQKASGIDKVIAEKQKQFDAFLSEK
jgi:putative aldouronate transport system substrate-binding protein